MISTPSDSTFTSAATPIQKKEKKKGIKERERGMHIHMTAFR